MKNLDIWSVGKAGVMMLPNFGYQMNKSKWGITKTGSNRSPFYRPCFHLPPIDILHHQEIVDTKKYFLLKHLHVFWDKKVKIEPRTRQFTRTLLLFKNHPTNDHQG